MKSYENDGNFAHLFDELERIKNIIVLGVTSTRGLESLESSQQEFANLPNELLYLLSQPLAIPIWACHNPDAKRALLEKKIKKASGADNLKALPLSKLKQLFNLADPELDILLLCLICELDIHCQELCGYLHNNPSNRHLTIDLVLNLLSSTKEEKLDYFNLYFNSTSPLLRYCLLEGGDSPALEGVSLNNTIRISRRITNYLLGQDSITPPLTGIVKLSTFARSVEELKLTDNIRKQVYRLTECCNSGDISTYNMVIVMRGIEGSGRKTLALAICKELQVKLLAIDIGDLLSYKLDQWYSLLPLVQREAKLQNASVYWQNTHRLLEKGNECYLNLFKGYLADFTWLFFFAQLPYEHFPIYNSKSPLIEFEASNLPTKQRLELWQELVPSLSQSDLSEITNAFQLTPRQIHAVAANAKAQYLLESQEDAGALSKTEIYRACHEQARQYLSNFAKVIKPIHNGDNIILTQEQQSYLDDIVNYVNHRSLIYEEGGFNKKLSLGRGLISLFYGASGTGKTMAAEVVAGRLDLMLYKIDLSTVISKYIGETEKHLDRVFREAQSSNAILFFDEADALFAKRGEVESAKDNYANIQVSYLLQKIEEYTGIIILATNFKSNMDEAFTRRLHFCVDFSMPKFPERLRIWQNIWPENIHPSSDIDFQKLAQDLEISGGNIRNIALSASFKAVEKRENKTMPIEVTQEHLLSAIHQELRKMGRVIMHDKLERLF